MDPIDVFSSKANVYDRYRWSYAPQAIEIILTVSGLSTQDTLADIGAGFFRLPPALGKYSRSWLLADHITRSDFVNRPINIAPGTDGYLSKIQYPAQKTYLFIERFATAIIG